MAVRKRNSKKAVRGYTYQVYFDYTDYYGQKKHYSKSGFPNKREAQEHETRLKLEYTQYGDIIENKNVCFNEVFIEYMEMMENDYSGSTKQYYWYTFSKYVVDGIGRKNIFYLKYREIQEFFTHFEHGKANAKNIKKLFNITFKHAQKCCYIRENPMSLVKVIDKDNKIENNQDKLISEKELNTLCEKILVTSKNSPSLKRNQFEYQSYVVAIKIGWYTGMRISEVLGLKKSDINFKNRLINIDRRVEYHGIKASKIETVNKLKTKSARAQIPLAKPLEEILVKWFEVNPHEIIVANIKGAHIAPQALSARIYKISKDTGLIGFHFHCLRHNFTSNLIMSGALPSVVKELVRHSDIKTTLDIYTHIKKDKQFESIDEIFK